MVHVLPRRFGHESALIDKRPRFYIPHSSFYKSRTGSRHICAYILLDFSPPSSTSPFAFTQVPGCKPCEAMYHSLHPLGWAIASSLWVVPSYSLTSCTVTAWPSYGRPIWVNRRRTDSDRLCDHLQHILHGSLFSDNYLKRRLLRLGSATNTAYPGQSAIATFNLFLTERHQAVSLSVLWGKAPTTTYSL